MKKEDFKNIVLLTVCALLSVGVISVSMLLAVRWKQENPERGGFAKGGILSRFVAPDPDKAVCPTALPQYQAIMGGNEPQECIADAD